MNDTDNPWARHYQQVWESRAADPGLPYWLRVASLAYAMHTDNGHAMFKRGHIALVLGTPLGGGEVKPYPNVRRAIADAVTHGWLDPASYWGCLVVPPEAIKKGPLHHSPPCRAHAKRNARERRIVRPVSVSGARNQPQMSGSESESFAS